MRHIEGMNKYELTTVDGDVVDVVLNDFFGCNELEDQDEIEKLEVGEVYFGGGGAYPTWSIRRVS